MNFHFFLDMMLLTYFLIISLKFENCYLYFQYFLVNECDIIEMTYQLVGLLHTYGEGALTVNKDALDHRLNNAISAIVHPYQHHHVVTLCREKYFCTILNSNTVDLISMIYKTINFRPITPFLYLVHYPLLIFRYGYNFFVIFLFLLIDELLFTCAISF